MIQFYLVTKSGEVINNTRCKTLSEAITYFATVKNLKEEDLIKIFDVK